MQGFQATTVSVNRQSAKRNSVINMNRNDKPVYQSNVKKSKLGIPSAETN